ncbi:MAG: circadian clock KaiB family protein [Desulforhopalus sp.]
MKEKPVENTSTEAFETALDGTPNYVLKLFVSGMTSCSVRAVQNIRKICHENLEGRVELEVIDIYQQPEMAKQEQIVAVPTLIKKLPLPLRQFIGDLSDTEKILVGLNLSPRAPKDRIK